MPKPKLKDAEELKIIIDNQKSLIDKLTRENKYLI